MSFILLGILNAQVAGITAAPAYDLLETEILTGSQATVTFSSLNSTYGSTYQHLQFRMTLRTDRALTTDSGIFTINGITGASYATHNLTGTGSTPTSGGAGSQARIEFGNSITGATNTANVYSGHILDLLDAFETTKNTTARTLSGAAGSSPKIELFSGFLNNTAAVDSVTFDAIGNYVAGCRLSLYGLKASA